MFPKTPSLIDLATLFILELESIDLAITKQDADVFAYCLMGDDNESEAYGVLSGDEVIWINSWNFNTFDEVASIKASVAALAAKMTERSEIYDHSEQST